MLPKADGRPVFRGEIAHTSSYRQASRHCVAPSLDSVLAPYQEKDKGPPAVSTTAWRSATGPSLAISTMPSSPKGRKLVRHEQPNKHREPTEDSRNHHSL